MALENIIPKGYTAFAEMMSPRFASIPKGNVDEYVSELAKARYRKDVDHFAGLAELFETRTFNELKKAARKDIEDALNRMDVKAVYDPKRDACVLVSSYVSPTYMVSLTRHVLGEVNSLFKECGSKTRLRILPTQPTITETVSDN